MKLNRQQQRAVNSTLLRGSARDGLSLSLMSAFNVLDCIEQAEPTAGATENADAGW